MKNNIFIIEKILFCMSLVHTSKNISHDEIMINLKRKICKYETLQEESQQKDCLITPNSFSSSDIGLQNIHKTFFFPYFDEPLDLSIKRQNCSNLIQVNDEHNLPSHNPSLPQMHVEKQFNSDLSLEAKNESPDLNYKKKSNIKKMRASKNVQSENQATSSLNQISTCVDINQYLTSLPQQYQIQQKNSKNNNLYQAKTYPVDFTHHTPDDAHECDLEDQTSCDEGGKFSPHASVKYLIGVKDIPIENKSETTDDLDHSFTQQEESESNSEAHSHQKEIKKRTRILHIQRKIFIVDQLSLWECNLKFISEISSYFTFDKKMSSQYDLNAMCTNLGDFLLKQIDITKVAVNNINSTQYKKGVRKFIPKISNSTDFCPFCEIQKLEEGKEREINVQKFINDFPKLKIGYELINSIKQLFHEIYTTFTKMPFSAENLFSSQFFISQRMFFEDVIKNFDSQVVQFRKQDPMNYTHIEYHKLFRTNIDMKIHFLPELESILYVLWRSPLYLQIMKKNRKSIILFFLFFSLNEFFEWINQFYQENKIIHEGSNSSLSKFISQSISFICRIFFIEPILSQFTIHKNAQMRYHFLCLNIFYDELCIFLGKENPKHILASNSRILLKIIILIEKYVQRNLFAHYLESNPQYILRLEQFDLNKFFYFLILYRKTNNSLLSNQSDDIMTIISSLK